MCSKLAFVGLGSFIVPIFGRSHLLAQTRYHCSLKSSTVNAKIQESWSSNPATYSLSLPLRMLQPHFSSPFRWRFLWPSPLTVRTASQTSLTLDFKRKCCCESASMCSNWRRFALRRIDSISCGEFLSSCACGAPTPFYYFHYRYPALSPPTYVDNLAILTKRTWSCRFSAMRIL